MDSSRLRQAFTGFFAERGHVVLESAGLIPTHPALPLIVNAGMNKFPGVFLGEEPPPAPRATTIQKCFRTVDIDIVGTTNRHCTFFEMMGNFSFGDYFKEGAIAMGWELVTQSLGMDAERLWITVHESDDEAEAIWRDAIGLPGDRIQKMGEDNFWKMGDTGPCGPCSEIYFDKGPAHGPDGGPAHGGAERFVEIWNLVFMQYNRLADGALVDLPRRNIDTGAGLERILPILNGTDSIFGTDVLLPMLQTAQSATGRTYGRDEADDVGLRILADHARGMSFLISDGVLPSNEGRGYVLRRVIRRAVRRAQQLGTDKLITPALTQTTIEVMGDAYPELKANAEAIGSVAVNEEERFRHTLRSGSAILESELANAGRVSGQVAFRLHDTYGFPIELTREIAAEAGVEVDQVGFETAMDDQRRRARSAAKGQAEPTTGGESDYRQLLEEFGASEFVGYSEVSACGRVLGVLPAVNLSSQGGIDLPTGEVVEIYLDRTPFYAEGGGQVGDTGVITTSGGRALVVDTTAPLPGLIRHTAVVVEGSIRPDQDATAAVDGDRRDCIRRNHTGTHLLHWALREVLGDHVRQHGSLVAPDRLRFDFSHHQAVSAEELSRVQALVNARILTDEPVRTYETSRSEAAEAGALAFFGDRYGERVRVVEAGSASVELCGGTHVSGLGMIGPLVITGEASIGSGTRRIEAVTGTGSLSHFDQNARLLARLAEMVRSTPADAPDAVSRLLVRQRQADDELASLRSLRLVAQADDLAAAAVSGRIVTRCDGMGPEELRELATTARSRPGIEAVVLVGSPDGARVSLVATVTKDSGLVASDLIGDAARLVGGGGGRGADLAMAGGKDVS
ncbi:MAG: alanine--tRNA ligase, partial [Acidimicrobiales bacterium]